MKLVKLAVVSTAVLLAGAVQAQQSGMTFFVTSAGKGNGADLGMVGALYSVIGMAIEPVIERFLLQLPNRFDPVDSGPAVFNSVLIQIDEETGRALAIERVDREVA